jgi:hypothetical protein
MEFSSAGIFLNRIAVSFCLISFCGIGLSQGTGKLVQYDTEIRIENSNRIEENKICIKVESKNADELSDITISYNKSEKLEILDAYVMNADLVTVRKLQKKEITTRSDISEGLFYQDDMAKEFSLRGNQYPYYIFYSYRVTSNQFLHVANWTPYFLLKGGSEMSRLKVVVPLNYIVYIRSQGDLRFSKDSTENKLIYYWEAKDLKPIRPQLLAPPFSELAPWVTVVPEDFTYGKPGSLDSWQALGQWVDDINSGLDELPLSEQIRITPLLSGISDRREKMKILYHYLQDNTHYIAVSIGFGNLQSYPASYVCSNRYGDCKALSMYMKALLKFAGIPSYYTLVYGGSDPVRTKKDFPSSQFNHVILCVPDGRDTVWLENTWGDCPFGYLGSFTQNRWALVVNGEKSRLVKTPELKTADVWVNSVYKVKPKLDGSAEFSLVKEMKGDEFETYLQYSKELQDEKLKEAIKKRLPLNSEILKYEFLPRDRDSRSLTVKVDFMIPGFVRDIGGNKALGLTPVTLASFERPEERKYPVRISSPISFSDSVWYDLALFDSFRTEAPSQVNIVSKFGSYTAAFIVKENKVLVLKKLDLPTEDILPEEYPQFWSFIESVKKSVKSSALILYPRQ